MVTDKNEAYLKEGGKEEMGVYSTWETKAISNEVGWKG